MVSHVVMAVWYKGRMELRHLKTFVAAARELSFTRAAKALELTQGAVSQHVAAIEKQLTVRLFERSGRQVRLTEAGKRLYDYAQRIVDLTEEAIREVSQQETALSGTLRIATSTVPAELLLPRMLGEFRKLFPNVHESVVVSDSDAAIQCVENHEADVGLVGELPNSPHLMSHPVAADELILVVPPDHPFANKSVIGAEDLRDETLIVREAGSGSRHCVEKALEAKGISMASLSIGIEMNSNDAIASAVACGAGIAFLSAMSLKKEIEEEKIVPVKVRGLRAKRQLYLITHECRSKSSPVREFLDFVDQWKSPS